MSKSSDQQNLSTVSIYSVVRTIDQDVAHGEDILMLGYGLVLMAPLFAPVLPPHILLPAMALCFVLSVCRARFHFYRIQAKAEHLQQQLSIYQREKISPILDILKQHPQFTLTHSFNPFKNWLRTGKSMLGALLINPFWMPIFYMLGLQFAEEKQLQLLNQAVLKVEHQLNIHH